MFGKRLHRTPHEFGLIALDIVQADVWRLVGGRPDGVANARRAGFEFGGYVVVIRFSKVSVRRLAYA